MQQCDGPIQGVETETTERKCCGCVTMKKNRKMAESQSKWKAARRRQWVCPSINWVDGWCKGVHWRFAHLVNDWKRSRDRPVTMTEEDKIGVIADLIKLPVCPRLRDDHSGRLVEHTTQTSNFIAAKSCDKEQIQTENDDGGKPRQRTIQTDCHIRTIVKQQVQG